MPGCNWPIKPVYFAYTMYFGECGPKAWERKRSNAENHKLGRIQDGRACIGLSMGGKHSKLPTRSGSSNLRGCKVERTGKNIERKDGKERYRRTGVHSKARGFVVPENGCVWLPIDQTAMVFHLFQQRRTA